MGIPKIDTGPMTIEEFYTFTDARPDEEKWELIDGEPVLSAVPSDFHQLILGNLVVALTVQERRCRLRGGRYQASVRGFRRRAAPNPTS